MAKQVDEQVQNEAAPSEPPAFQTWAFDPKFRGERRVSLSERSMALLFGDKSISAEFRRRRKRRLKK